MSEAESDPSRQAPRLPLSIRPVTRENWQQVIALRLAPSQAGLLASNLYSLAEAGIEPQCQPRAIVAGATVVGFAMFEYIEGAAAFNIPRFMIDRHWQGRGYGAAALAAIVDTLKADRPEAGIMISLLPGNDAARRLYERQGFVDTGTRYHGEDVLKYP